MSSISRQSASTFSGVEEPLRGSLRRLFDGAAVILDGAPPATSVDKPGLPGDMYIDGEYLVFWAPSVGQWRRILGSSF